MAVSGEVFSPLQSLATKNAREFWTPPPLARVCGICVSSSLQTSRPASFSVVCAGSYFAELGSPLPLLPPQAASASGTATSANAVQRPLTRRKSSRLQRELPSPRWDDSAAFDLRTLRRLPPRGAPAARASTPVQRQRPAETVVARVAAA